MSHFVTVKCQYKDQAALVEALEGIVGKGSVEVHATPQTIVGYNGVAGEGCTVVVRKCFGFRYGDAGWRRNPDGTFTQCVDAYDERRLASLPQRYAVAVTRKQAKLSGFAVGEQTMQDGTVKLTLSKWGGQ